MPRPQVPRPIASVDAPGRSVLQRYLRCVAGGQPAGTGLPDGDGRLSIVRNFRFVRTLRPDSGGSLVFRLGFTPWGVINQVVGATASITEYPTLPSAIGGFTSSTTTSSAYTFNDYIVPGSPDPLNTYSASNPAIPSLYRIPNATFKVRYTGTSLDNSGSVVINQITPQFSPDTIQTYSTPRPVFSSKAMGAIVNNGQTVIGSARDSYSMVAVPRDAEYASSFEVSRGSFNQSVFAIGSTGAGFRPHPSMKMFNLDYRGLSTTASITVEADVCVQYLVDPDDPEAAIARPSEVAPQSSLLQTLAALSGSPLVAQGTAVFGQVAKALASQGLSALVGPQPARAIMDRF